MGTGRVIEEQYSTLCPSLSLWRKDRCQWLWRELESVARAAGGEPRRGRAEVE